MIRALDEAIKEKSSSYLREAFSSRGLPGDIVEDYRAPAHDPHTRLNRYIVELEDQNGDSTKMVGFPLFMSQTPARLHARAPYLGQHTAEILHEMLDYSEDQIAELLNSNVIASTA